MQSSSLQAALVMEFLNGKDPNFNTDLHSTFLPYQDPLAPNPQPRQQTALFALDEQLLRSALSGNNSLQI